MKTLKLILFFISFLSFVQLKSQCLDSIKVAQSSTDSITFNIYLGSNNDTTNLIIVNRWGQIVKKVLNDSIMQFGQHTIVYYPSSTIISDNYFYSFTSHGGCSHNGHIIYINSSTGIKQYINNSTFSIYPNPNNGNVIIQSLNENELGLIDIYNAIGKLVYQEEIKNNSIQVDISNQATGIYFVKVQNQFFKLIKN
jgi:hypothetical protein